MTDTDRLDTLETRIVHQDVVIEDLNKTVIAQWKEIDRLTRQVARLTEQYANAVQAMSSEPGEDTPPPHW
ncbi:SlyX family protein [Hyphomonas johnsonii]|uniref:Protein SlyX homolog n=1 Tax=Hyphomonas johnsonii MHS-2 TaxID=1280950 RepID=A0A059FHD4_9PROT|nr:SlyX family protein [Hyphomonas johnsonii]KCZ90030.1 SlyX family protein [Hyphomonas johnsonii MHS-2]